MSALLAGILFFLGAALLFYVLFGGADFGAGILELFLGRERREDQRRVITHAMAPVWEANHMWLVLSVVILFMGFPRIYSWISVSLHLPLLALLMGIVARGCAFTFRHYDTWDRIYYRLYSRIFAFSSLWTTFFIGVIAGALMVGRISPGATASYRELFISPWWNAFSLSIGLFTCGLFSLLASVYLLGETSDEGLRAIFIRKCRAATGVAVLSGALVLATARVHRISGVEAFFESPLSRACFIAATLVWFPLWKSIRSARSTIVTRILVASLVALVLLGCLSAQLPATIRRFTETAAPEPTQRALLSALYVGAILIFPALFYLLRVFKWQVLEREDAGSGVRR